MQAFFTLEYFLKMTANFCIPTVFKNGKCKRPTCEQYLKKVEQLRPFHFNCSKALAFERVTTYSGAFISFLFQGKQLSHARLSHFKLFQGATTCIVPTLSITTNNITIKTQHLAFRHLMLSVTFAEKSLVIM
jgi:hypothetical protein